MIVGLTGAPGTGKSYFLADQAWKGFCAGKDVYSNFTWDYELAVSCYGGRFGGPEPADESRDQLKNRLGRWFPIRSYQALCDVAEGVLLFDEAHLWAFSRNYRELPFELIFWWSQSRKRGVDVYFATQRWESVDTMLRELAHYRVKCYRVLSGFSYRTEDPRLEKKMAFSGWRRLKMDPVVSSLYDTNEILPPPGWEEGRPTAVGGGRQPVVAGGAAQQNGHRQLKGQGARRASRHPVGRES